MGLVYADIELFNLADEILCEDGYLPKEKIRQMTINAMADSGAIRLAINENIRQQDRKSTRLNSSHPRLSRMPSSA